MPDKIQSPTPLSNLLGELMTPITTYRQNIDTLSRERQQIEQGIISRYSDCTLSPLTVSQIRKAENARAYCENCAGYPCRKPSSKGFKPVIKVKDGAVHIASEICQYARREREQSVFRRKFSSAKIPNPYVGKTFGDYETDKTNNEAVAWAHNAVDKGEGVYLHGDQGCGKTFLAAIIAQELLKKGKTVIFSDVPTLLETLKSTFDDDDTSITELMANMATADVLVLDDLGTETPTEWAVERLYMIVNQRYNADKMIIITSNLDTDAAADRLNHPRKAPAGVYGSRILSRIKQMCHIAIIGGGDRRGAKANGFG